MHTHLRRIGVAIGHGARVLEQGSGGALPPAADHAACALDASDHHRRPEEPLPAAVMRDFDAAALERRYEPRYLAAPPQSLGARRRHLGSHARALVADDPAVDLPLEPQDGLRARRDEVIR